jgi:hypothetical protein
VVNTKEQRFSGATHVKEKQRNEIEKQKRPTKIMEKQPEKQARQLVAKMVLNGFYSPFMIWGQF